MRVRRKIFVLFFFLNFIALNVSAAQKGSDAVVSLESSFYFPNVNMHDGKLYLCSILNINISSLRTGKSCLC